MTKEIDISEWVEFFSKFNDLNQGGTISVEHQDTSGKRNVVANESRFEGLHFSSDACNDIITIGLATAPGRRDLDHAIVEPIRVFLKTDNQNRKTIQIQAENGTTQLAFSNGRFPLEAGEVKNKEVSEKSPSGRQPLAGQQGR